MNHMYVGALMWLFALLPGNTVMPWQNRKRKSYSRGETFAHTTPVQKLTCLDLGSSLCLGPKIVRKSITFTVKLHTCNSCYFISIFNRLTNMDMCVLGSPGFLKKTVNVLQYKVNIIWDCMNKVGGRNNINHAFVSISNGLNPYRLPYLLISFYNRWRLVDW